VTRSCLDCSAVPLRGRSRCARHLAANAKAQRARKAARKRWRQANPDRIRRYRRNHRLKHGDRVRAVEREKYARNPTPKREAATRWRRANPKRHIENHRAWKYGLARGAYDAMLKAQGGLCAVCRQPETARANHGGPLRSLAVDHCHATGKVRELLCARCNSILGLAKDDPRRLRAAVAYLARHGIR